MRGVSVMRDSWDAAAAVRHELAWPVRPFAARFATHAGWPSLEDLNRALGGAVSFVPCPPRRRHRRRAPVAASELYDGRIALAGEVPTRLCCWHDFFNALVWAAWPRAKRRLHERQHQAIAERVAGPTFRLPSARTRELDRLAMLDEGGVVLLAGPEHADALRSALAQGDEAAVRALLAAGAAELIVFGHAVLDHLRTGAVGSGLYARAEVVTAPAGLPPDRSARLAVADEELARALSERRAPEPGPVAALRLE